MESYTSILLSGNLLIQHFMFLNFPHVFWDLLDFRLVDGLFKGQGFNKVHRYRVSQNVSPYRDFVVKHFSKSRPQEKNRQQNWCVMYEPNQHNAIQGGIEYSIPPWCHLFYFPELLKKNLFSIRNSLSFYQPRILLSACNFSSSLMRVLTRL